MIERKDGEEEEEEEEVDFRMNSFSISREGRRERETDIWTVREGDTGRGR